MATFPSIYFAGFAVTVTMMFIVWLLEERLKNGGIVDVVWGFGFAVVVVAYWILLGFALPDARQSMILAMVLIWSLRLGFFLLQRFMRHYPEEDGRYKSFREAWGAKASLGMFLAFQLQAVLLASLCLPFATSMANAGSPGLFEFAGLAIFVVAIIGETMADNQLDTFKKNPDNRGKVCQVGLWNYSRHPNYFFEWLIWVSFFIFAMGSPFGIYSVYCPCAMLFFLLKVTGVKATEEQALRTKGDAYRYYQESTSAFVPWFKKHLQKGA